MKGSTAIALFLLFFLVLGCDEPYVKQPLAKEPDSLETGVNATQIARIQERIGVEKADFSFAITADTHQEYGDLQALLQHLRSDSSVSFILVCGDVTEKGDRNELKDYLRIMKEQPLPFVTAIGNREHRGTGRPTFEAMFGARNQQFVAGGVRFVLFDNVVTESEIPIEYDWLRTTLAAPHEGPTIVLMHVPPTDPSQLSPDHLHPLHEIIAGHKPAHVFMGHTHFHSAGEFPDGTPFTTAPWPKAGEWVKVEVERGKFKSLLVKVDRT